MKLALYKYAIIIIIINQKLQLGVKPELTHCVLNCLRKYQNIMAYFHHFSSLIWQVAESFLHG